MKKILFGIFSLIFTFSSLAQKKPSVFDAIQIGKFSKKTKKGKLEKEWFSTGELEFILSNEVIFDDGLSRGIGEKVSYGALYSINYPILNKLTIGAVGGFQHQILPKISTLKVGGILRYHFVDYDNVNLYSITAYHISLRNDFKSGMGNIRLGLSFPISKFDSFNLNLNLFWEYNFYTAIKPIFNANEEIGSTFIYRAYGISLGLKF